MKKIKKYQPIILIILIISSIIGLIFMNRKPKMILFYSSSCPHCKNVENYINDNNVKSKYKFQELEVSANKINSALLGTKASQCGLDTSSGIGVPLFYDGQNCLVGDQDIINYFKK